MEEVYKGEVGIGMDTVCQSPVLSLPVDDGITIPNKYFLINQEVVSIRHSNQSISGDEMMRTFVGDLKSPLPMSLRVLHGYWSQQFWIML